MQLKVEKKFQKDSNNLLLNNVYSARQIEEVLQSIFLHEKSTRWDLTVPVYCFLRAI